MTRELTREQKDELGRRIAAEAEAQRPKWDDPLVRREYMRNYMREYRKKNRRKPAAEPRRVWLPGDPK